MADPVAGSIGALLNLLIKQGSDFFLEVTLTDADTGQPIDLTGKTPRAHLRKEPFGLSVVEFACTKPATDKIRYTLTNAQTTALPCGAELDDDASQYVWDSELVDATTGIITPAFHGDAQVYRNI